MVVTRDVRESGQFVEEPTGVVHGKALTVFSDSANTHTVEPTMSPLAAPPESRVHPRNAQPLRPIRVQVWAMSPNLWLRFWAKPMFCCQTWPQKSPAKRRDNVEVIEEVRM